MINSEYINLGKGDSENSFLKLIQSIFINVDNYLTGTQYVGRLYRF